MDLKQHDEYLKNRIKTENEITIFETEGGEDDNSITLYELIKRLESLKEKIMDIDFEADDCHFVTTDDGLYFVYDAWETIDEYVRRKGLEENMRKLSRARLKREIKMNFTQACEIIDEIKNEDNIC